MAELPLFIRLDDQRQFAVSVPASGTVSDVRAALAAAVGDGEGASGWRLSWHGRVLDDRSPLADAGLTAEAELQAAPALRPEPSTGVSEYNAAYKCRVTAVELMDDPPSIAVGFDVMGDGSLGALQEPEYSRLCVRSESSLATHILHAVKMSYLIEN
eukprot:gene12614-21420_t